MSGGLIAVVGASGVGKDSVMRGIVAARPDIRLVRRVITRPDGVPGEAHQAMTERDFEIAETRGAFALTWRAHGLSYGIPAGVLSDVAAGQTCLVNLSRGAVLDAARLWPALIVLCVTAAPEIRAARLAARGRETAEDVRARLLKAEKALPSGVAVTEIANDGALDTAVAHAVRVLTAKSHNGA